MHIYFPIAEISLNVYWIIALGITSGFLAAIFGVGGNFIIVPFLVALGIEPSIALSSTVNHSIAASCANFIKHNRKGSLDLKLGIELLKGAVIGAIIGTIIFKLLKETGYLTGTVTLIYMLLLGTLGSTLAIESFKKLFSKNSDNRHAPLPPNKLLSELPLKRYFEKANIQVSLIAVITIGFIVGILIAISGIGGGVILVPMLIYLLGVPTKIAIGTSVFQMLVNMSLVTTLHSLVANTVDIILALFLTLGALIGIKIGGKIADKLSPVLIRAMLAIILLSMFCRLGIEVFIEPTHKYVFNKIR